MNSIILTALESKCPLNSISLLDFRMTKSAKPKIDTLNIKNSFSLYFTGTCNIQS